MAWNFGFNWYRSLDRQILYMNDTLLWKATVRRYVKSSNSFLRYRVSPQNYFLAPQELQLVIHSQAG